jgi:hypothetical protein
MKKSVCLLVFCAALVGTATGGKNEGGALVVHTDDAYMYYRSFCSDFEDWVPQDCELLNTRTDHDVNTPSLIWFIAAFDPACSPGVTSIYFGNDHNLPAYYHNRWGFCGPAGTVEHPDPGWPEDPAGAGIWVEFGSPVVNDHFFTFYRVDVWGFEGAYYGTGAHPNLGYAAFEDDQNPPELDFCDRFGQVRWYEPGYNECPEPPVATESVTWGRMRSTYR